MDKMEVCFAVLDLHFGVLLGVHHGRNGDTEVGDGAPEVCRKALSANPAIKHILTPNFVLCSSSTIHCHVSWSPPLSSSH